SLSGNDHLSRSLQSYWDFRIHTSIGNVLSFSLLKSIWPSTTIEPCRMNPDSIRFPDNHDEDVPLRDTPHQFVEFAWRCAKSPHSIYYAAKSTDYEGRPEELMESEQRTQEAAQRKTITYDGEGYTRESLEKMLSDYQTKNALDLEKFGQLSQAYQRLTKEMTHDVSDQKSAFEYLSNIVSLDKVGTNIKGLLHKIPIARELAPSRDLKELLGEKIEIAQRRIKEAGNYLDTLQADMKALHEDIVSLNNRMIVARP